MIPLIIGGVTLAAVGYVIKEICDEEGCPWDDIYSSDQEESDEEEVRSYKKSKKFHKLKKTIYKNTMQEYQTFLDKYEVEFNDFSTDEKLQKQKFSDELVNDELKSYIEQISSTLEILSYKLVQSMKTFKDKEEGTEELLSDITNYANAIYRLCTLQLFDNYGKVNQVEVLSNLVQTMPLTTQKNTMPVNLKSA